MAILDLISVTSSLSWDIKKTKNSYSGAWVSVRRTSDNAETDIGFDANGNGDFEVVVGGNCNVIQTNIDGAVTLAGTQTLTNKTMSGASNIFQIYRIR